MVFRDTRSIPIIKVGSKYLKLPPFFIPPFFVIAGIIISVVLLFPYTTTVQSFDLPKIGEAAKETIIAPFSFDIIRSPEELEKERKKASDQIILIFDYDSNVKKRVHKKLLELQNNIQKFSDKNTTDYSKNALHQSLSKELSENAINSLVKNPRLFEEAVFISDELLEKGISNELIVPTEQKLDEYRSLFNTSFDKFIIDSHQFVTLKRDSQENTIRAIDLPVKEIAVEGAIKRLKEGKRYNDESLTVIYELLSLCIYPNIKFNSVLTFQIKQKAAQDVLAINGKVIKDTEIVRKHQEVTAEIVQKLRSLRIALDKISYVQERRKIRSSNIGRLLMALIPLLFIGFYIKSYSPGLMKNFKSLFAYGTLFVFQISIIRIGLVVVPKLFEGAGEMSAFTAEYLIPVTTCSILATILFSVELSLLLTLFVSMFFGIVMGFNLFFFIYVLLGGVVSIFCVKNIRYRMHFFKAIPPVVLMYVILVSLWQMIGHKISFPELLVNYGLMLINVLISMFLAMMLTPIYEKLFDITTDMTLVELSDMNNPILKRLSIEAAGTYNHSVLVANLAESAAQKIGANSLLARVASYYHDVGKIEKSDYFVENCLTLEKNRHNKLAPSMSALIICSHVKEGVEIAKKYKVPKVIQDVILQHHGTSTVSFFYEKALELDPHKQVQEQDFRYPGPTPQTRETAIIMLADSVEAAARSLATSSPKLLRELVKKIIRDKFFASQLDQCDLTLRDLDEIVEGFMPVLQGIFHSRIEYPPKKGE